jgi:hypothetical protein
MHHGGYPNQVTEGSQCALPPFPKLIPSRALRRPCGTGSPGWGRLVGRVPAVNGLKRRVSGADGTVEPGA